MAAVRTILVGILETGLVKDPSRFGSYPDMFKKLLNSNEDFLECTQLDFVVWPVINGTFPGSVNDADVWLITGSPFGVYEDHPWIYRLIEFVKLIYNAQVHMIGICFGHQIIAQALGGKVEKSMNGWFVLFMFV